MIPVFVFIKLQQFEYLNGRVLIHLYVFEFIFSFVCSHCYTQYFIFYIKFRYDWSITFPMQKILIWWPSYNCHYTISSSFFIIFRLYPVPSRPIDTDTPAIYRFHFIRSEKFQIRRRNTYTDRLKRSEQNSRRFYDRFVSRSTDGISFARSRYFKCDQEERFVLEFFPASRLSTLNPLHWQLVHRNG